MAELNNSNVKFPYYSGNIKLTKVLGFVSLSQFIRAHQNPSERSKKILKLIRDGVAPEKKRELKQMLYAFTPSVFIEKNDKRKYENIKKYTGIMQIDLDGIPNYDLAIDLKNWVFAQPECICSYLSPSNNVKALIRIKPSVNKEEYIEIHNAVAKKYEETGFFDKATKNAVLPLFLSSDKFIFYRDFNKAFEWNEKLTLNPGRTSLNDDQNKQPNFNNSDLEEKTIKIFKNKISSISSEGHTQVLSACLILGSRVSAGYIDKLTALALAEYEIRLNNYLSKGTSGYIETSAWAINQGINNPKYY
jgi:hypothetical protein